MATIRELRARFTASAQGFKASVNEIGKNLDQVAKQSQETTKVMNQGWNGVIKTMAGVTKAYLGIGAVAMGAGVAGMIAVTNQYQVALGQLEAQTGATGEQMKAMDESMRNIYAQGYGADFADIAESMALVENNTGLAGEALEKATKDAIILRDTFQYDVAESTATADTMMKQFGITSDQAFELIAQGAQAGFDKSGDMLGSLNEYSVYFQQLGYDAEGMWNVYNAGISAGVMNTDVIGDTIKEFGILAKDGSDSTREAFQGLGLDATAMEQAIAKGGPTAQKAMQQTFEALGKISDPVQRNALGVALFGTKFEDLEHKAVIALGSVTDQANMSGDAMKKINDAKFENIGAQFEILKRQIIDGLLLPFQAQVMPLVKEFVSFIQANMPAIKDALIGAFTGFMGIIQQIAPIAENLFTILWNVGSAVAPLIMGAIQGILAVIVPLATWITDIGAKFTSWEGFTPILYGLITAITVYNARLIAMNLWTGIITTATKAWAIAQRLLNLAMAMNPIMLIVALIAGLVVALITAYQKSETFRNIVNGVWAGIKTVVMAVINWFITTIPQWISNMVTWFTGMGSSISSIWSTMITAIVNFFTGLWTSISSIATSIWTFLVSIWTSISTTVSALVSAFVSAVVGFVTNMVTNIMNFVSPLITFFVNTWTNIKLLVLGIIGVFLNLITGNMEGLKISLLAIWTAIKNQVINIITMLKNMGINIFNAYKTAILAIWNGLKTAGLAIWNGLKSASLAIWNGLKSAVISIVEGIKNGAVNSWNALKSSALAIWSGLKSAVTGMVEGLRNSITNGIDNAKNSVINGFNSAKSSAINAWNALKSGVQSAIQGVIGFVSNMKSNIISTIQGIDLRSIGVNIIQGLINGIKSMVGAVGDAIKSVASNVTDKIKGALGIHSPSRVMLEIGKFTGEGLGIGIQKMQAFVADATQGLADASFGTINSAELNPITATVGVPAPGQPVQSGTNYNAPLMNIENYYQNDQTDVRSISNNLYNMQRNSDRKKGK